MLEENGKNTKQWVIPSVKCAHCGVENNLHFVMYYKDKCWNCDGDVFPNNSCELGDLYR